ncbi:transcription antitermination factor NusB [Nocardioides alcanivorans]|uniref:transcription antitermination factor NusB n=1 Tax=Nocardioides alcanivorans TaxID=2897352 RepID=UPI0024B17AA2|nr:transcription antitermination factor NusB [Nocardioides alcanivorans]
MAAHEVLSAVRDADAYTNLVLPSVLARRQLSGRDAAFVTELASGTIRWQGTYDAILAACIDRPLAKVEAAVHDVLRLGAHQLLAMRVPDHAAISSSVELTRARIGQGPSGFVNAVLRKVARRSLDEWLAEVAPGDGHDQLALRTSHPTWVVDLLAQAWTGCGGSEEQVEEMLSADNVAPAVTLVARPGLCEVDELEGADATRLSWSPWAVSLAGGNPGEIPAVAEGRAAVQDEGSQLVAAALAGARLGGRDAEWLDLCAGPGGKAGLLAALAAQRGARVLAVERQPHRAALVSNAVRAVPGVCEV